MARQKKTSKVIAIAAERLAGGKSIDENEDLGNGITVAVYEGKLEKSRKSLEKYNTSISITDESELIFEADEKDLRIYNELFLKAVGVKYGFDSPQYKMAGGTMKSERKKTSKSKKPQE